MTMPKKCKDIVEVRLERRRDYVIKCFNQIVKKATKRIYGIHNELRLIIDELDYRIEVETCQLINEVEIRLHEIKVATRNMMLAEGLNRTMAEKEVTSLYDKLNEYITNVFERIKKYISDLGKSVDDARKQINIILDETPDVVMKIWDQNKDQMELIYAKDMDIIGPRTLNYEYLIDLTENAIADILAPLPPLAPVLFEEEQCLYQELNKKLKNALAKVQKIKEDNFAVAEKMKKDIENQKKCK
ncbi:unnamed protein product [Phyllotreta striolata]|uniref:Uncharacterized protein n=1 Tax=Phyllotreta striolata TaxID=444603 RepID=A0A9N9TV44_PHYSR|nr:unnamed protein product [Phyllotreta striolata]